MKKEIVIEGIKDILEILNFKEKTDFQIKELRIFKKNLDKYKDNFLEIKDICDKKKIFIQEITRREYLKLKQTVNSTGIFLILEMEDYTDLEIEKIFLEREKVLILYNIQDPGNLGTIIRTAWLLGVDCIVTIGDSVRLSNTKVIRSIKGYFFGMKIIETKNDDFIFDILNKLNYRIFVADIGKDSSDIRDINFSEGKKAFLFGSEGKGLKDFDFNKIFNKNVKKIKINLANNFIDGSLNLAISCGIVLFEVSKYGRDAKINRFKE